VTLEVGARGLRGLFTTSRRQDVGRSAPVTVRRRSCASRQVYACRRTRRRRGSAISLGALIAIDRDCPTPMSAPLYSEPPVPDRKTRSLGEPRPRSYGPCARGVGSRREDADRSVARESPSPARPGSCPSFELRYSSRKEESHRWAIAASMRVVWRVSPRRLPFVSSCRISRARHGITLSPTDGHAMLASLPRRRSARRTSRQAHPVGSPGSLPRVLERRKKKAAPIGMAGGALHENSGEPVAFVRRESKTVREDLGGARSARRAPFEGCTPRRARGRHRPSMACEGDHRIFRPPAMECALIKGHSSGERDSRRSSVWRAT